MVDKWDIFLFDFDGTLVNSEKLHHQAYLEVAKQYGIAFAPDFAAYSAMAHFSDTALCDTIMALAPSLDWKEFYAAKKRTYLEIVALTEPEFMEGVEPLLEELFKRDVVTCVVTHSAKEQTENFCKKLPLLQGIKYWITREDYDKPKPAGDAYIEALKQVKSSPAQKVVGFEDTPRGLMSLLQIEAAPYLVSSTLDPKVIKEGVEKPFTHIKSFSEL